MVEISRPPQQNKTAPLGSTEMLDVWEEPTHAHETTAHPGFAFIGGIALDSGARADVYHRPTSSLWFAQGAIMVRNSDAIHDVIAAPITPMSAAEYEDLVTGKHKADKLNDDGDIIGLKTVYRLAPLHKALWVGLSTPDTNNEQEPLIDEAHLVQDIGPRIDSVTGKDITFSDPAVAQIVAKVQGFNDASHWQASWAVARRAHFEDPRVKPTDPINASFVHAVETEGIY